MNQPTPAIVAQGAVRRLPRLALLALCLAYIVPGFVGREPWRSADMAAIGYMLDMARGATGWLNPQLGGLPLVGDGLLPYWLGALAIHLAPGWMSAAAAVRVPFVLMLALTLLSTWYAVYYLARSPRAQPVAFAFGGEANPLDYARAMADGGLLALLACLGLAQLSHEANTSLAQLCFASMALYGIAALGYRAASPIAGLLIGLGGLVLSAAPSMAMLFGAGSVLLYLLVPDPAVGGRRNALRCAGWIALATVLAAALASALGVWQWRLLLGSESGLRDWRTLSQLLLWFTWPAWPLVLWTLWRWRRQVFSRTISLHLALPLWVALVCVVTTLITRPSDRALMLALPSLATLAAFALPTLQRSVSALVDWFTLLFFSGCGIILWVIWIAMQTGVPRQPAANVVKQAPGFVADFSWPSLVVALVATAAWGWIVAWRVGRHRPAIWKSLVLPASGATLCWLLLTTLWMPLLDYVRSYTLVVHNTRAVIGQTECVEHLLLSREQIAAFRYHANYRIVPAGATARCAWMLVSPEQVPNPQNRIDLSEWQYQATIRRPSDKADDVVVYRRLTTR